MSGLQIFNAHPALYLGQTSAFKSPLFAIDAVRGGCDCRTETDSSVDPEPTVSSTIFG